jgi:uncharacterized protein YbjT (DUF2867 family)
MPYRAIVIGATGAVGGALVRELLASAVCDGVIALTRRPIDGLRSSDKLRVHVVNLADLEAATTRLGAGCAAAFCTMGVGQPRKIPFEEFRRVDVDYAGAFARGAAAAGSTHISLLSSVGADESSRNPYLKVKGDAERVVKEAGIARTSLFRPSLLVTPDIRYGLQDRVTQTLFPVIQPILPRRYQSVRVEDLGRAMCVNAERPGQAGVEVLEYPEFVQLLQPLGYSGGGA